MRATKELLEIVLDEFDNERITRNYSGICPCIRFLWLDSLITQEEKYFLLWFIKENRPTTGEHFDFTRMKYAWFWEPSSKPPRIAWLKYLIEKESKK